MRLKNLLLLLLLLFSFGLSAQEICNNGIDDDGDGLIDLNDVDDCECLFVGGNTEVESLIPNASFEDTECCPSSYSQLDCASTWIQASTATSDYMNSCDFMPSAVPQPLPEGDACVGAIFTSGWLECIGACLDAPFIAGEDYLLNMNISSVIADGVLNYVGPNDLGNIDIVIYGSPNCSDLPFSGSGCPLEDVSGDWEIIGSVDYDPSSGEWEQISIELSSTVDINAIVLGPPCDLPDAYLTSFNYPYFMYDDLTLNEASLFQSSVDGLYYEEENDVWIENGNIFNEDTGEWEYVGAVCADVVQLNGQVDTVGTFQWFYEGVALENETDSILEIAFDEFQQGEYQFVLYVNGGPECTSASYVTDVPEFPEANFEMQNVCFPDNVEFSDLSTFDPGSIIGWEWTFEGEIESTDENTSHYYESEGPHEVTLVVQSNNFCRDTLVTDISINADPVVQFSIENACVGEITNFMDETTVSNANLTSWDWDFDDSAATSDLQNPSYTYDVYQEYDVQLTVEADNGCSSETTITISAYPTPQVQFSSSPVCIESPDAQFINESTISEGSIDEWYWTFGDAEDSDLEDPMHTYTEVGEYDIELIGVSNFGCEGSDTGSQIVSKAIADFNYTMTEGCSPFCTEFTANGSSEYGTIAVVDWEFSNGETSLENDLEMCFENGSYTDMVSHDVKITVTNTYGCVDVMEQPGLIEVWPNPFANFDATPDRTDILTPDIEVTNLSIGGSEYNWDFGDGNVSEDFEPGHSYSSALIFPITLTVTSELGCETEITKLVDILPDYNIYIPNSFTPQGDGINEVFQPIVTGGVVEDYRFTIVNKWDEVIFSTDDPEAFWDGSFKNNQEYFVPDGVYVWTLDVKFERLQEPFVNKGTLLVIR